MLHFSTNLAFTGKIKNSRELYFWKDFYMNIFAITPNFQNIQTPKKNFLNNRNVIQANNLNYLPHDTVSFSGKEKAAKRTAHTIKDLIRDSYDAQIPKYRIMGNKLMDSLEVIANRLKDKGVTFDREYCEKSTVKSTKSFLSKLIRSGEQPMDRVRATLFVENPYDLKLINDELLPELNARGYELLMIPAKTSGRKVLAKKPDFDIRLADIQDKDIQHLSDKLKSCVGKPQKSGYEDIQMRLVDMTERGKDKTPIELIILFGKNYAEAKHNESYYVYDITRALSNTLHAAQVKEPELNTPAKRIQNNIAIIKDQLNSFISKPLYINAKNLDFYHDEFQLPVEITKANAEALNGLLEGIRSKIPLHYKAEIAKVSSKEYDKEIEKIIKSSAEYKDREDKTIYIDDMLETRKKLIKTLREHKAEDMEVIRAVQERFAETIKKYGKRPQTPKTTTVST